MVASFSSPKAFVITIDGPTASGKGTVAKLVADKLGFAYLDSGALYRLVGLCALQKNISAKETAMLAKLAETLPCRFEKDRVFLDSEDVTDAIRKEAVGMMASRVAAVPAVRAALVALQKRFNQPPGLVADGRDMGTAIFPEATLKIFLTASVEARAQRRYKQLVEKGFPAKIDSLRQDLQERDERDTKRSVSPLKPAPDAMMLDTTDMGIEETVNQILGWFKARIK